jgi:DNA adenine methylase
MIASPREALKAPFPWFGGKSRVADLVWDRFGDVPNYVEPFAGSLAVLLGRPHEARVETVNDKDAMIANFWRALQAEPDKVAWWADWPVNEADLYARHRWLVSEGRERTKRIVEDPGFYDCQVAGWWVWGLCLWLGGQWCNAKADPEVKRFSANRGSGRGVLRAHGRRIGNKNKGAITRRWQGGGAGGGSGVHAPRLYGQIPRLAGDAGCSGTGIHSATATGLYAFLGELGDRLRRVRVCVGDWSRVVTPSLTTYMGLTAVFLDPPYSHELREQCYAEDEDCGAAVVRWALEHGDNPLLRIAVCGYDGEHVFPPSWECVPWKAHGGYSRSERGKANRAKERVWFSPHCLKPGLFGVTP